MKLSYLITISSVSPTAFDWLMTCTWNQFIILVYGGLCGSDHYIKWEACWRTAMGWLHGQQQCCWTSWHPRSWENYHGHQVISCCINNSTLFRWWKCRRDTCNIYWTICPQPQLRQWLISMRLSTHTLLPIIISIGCGSTRGAVSDQVRLLLYRQTHRTKMILLSSPNIVTRM